MVRWFGTPNFQSQMWKSFLVEEITMVSHFPSPLPQHMQADSTVWVGIRLENMCFLV